MVKVTDVEKKIADIFVSRKIVSFSFKPPYVYSNGLKSPIYIDNRLLISYPKERSYVVDQLVRLIKNTKELKDIQFISSTLTYAAPYGVMVAQALNLPLVLVRREHREHGKKNKIEGIYPKGKKVLIIEEHISTGAAISDNVQTIRSVGGKVTHCIAVSEYELKIAQDVLKKEKVKTLTLARGSKIIETAFKKKMITKKQKEEVDAWLKDAVEWGQDRGYYREEAN